MIVETLFGEVCNLYGDPQNETYLRQTLPTATFISSSLDGEMYFPSARPDIILIGSMSDDIQMRVIEKLRPHTERIKELIDDGVVFLATGNACEVFCKNIKNVTLEIEYSGLGLFDFDVVVNWFDRYNGKVLGKFKDIVITGFRSQFSMIYGDNSDCAFIEMERGIGLNRQSKLEGFVKNNFFGTSVLGPILPLNPIFCEYLISLAGETATAAHRGVAMNAYEQRLAEFRDPKIKFD